MSDSEHKTIIAKQITVKAEHKIKVYTNRIIQKQIKKMPFQKGGF